MSLAFEINDEDVRTALGNLGHPEPSEQTSQRALQVASEHDARLTKAALYGNDLDEQTTYAQGELTTLLREHGFAR